MYINVFCFATTSPKAKGPRELLAGAHPPISTHKSCDSAQPHMYFSFTLTLVALPCTENLKSLKEGLLSPV